MFPFAFFPLPHAEKHSTPQEFVSTEMRGSRREGYRLEHCKPVSILTFCCFCGALARCASRGRYRVGEKALIISLVSHEKSLAKLLSLLALHALRHVMNM